MEGGLKILPPGLTWSRGDGVNVAKSDPSDGAFLESSHFIYDGQDGLQALCKATEPIVLGCGQNKHVFRNNDTPGVVLGPELFMWDR